MYVVNNDRANPVRKTWGDSRTHTKRQRELLYFPIYDTQGGRFHVTLIYHRESRERERHAVPRVYNGASRSDDRCNRPCNHPPGIPDGGEGGRKTLATPRRVTDGRKRLGADRLEALEG